MKASLSSVDIHFQALCNAVENEKIEKIRSILEHNPNLNTTSINADKLSPLDIAFMLGNVDILNMLMRSFYYQTSSFFNNLALNFISCFGLRA